MSGEYSVLYMMQLDVDRNLIVMGLGELISNPSRPQRKSKSPPKMLDNSHPSCLSH